MNNVIYEYEQRPETVFTADAKSAIDELATAEYAVLVGRNNCGKSYVLKTLKRRLELRAAYLGPARYQNFVTLAPYAPRNDRRSNEWRQFLEQWEKQNQNFDNSPLNLQQAIAELTDGSRAHLQEIMLTLLGIELTFPFVVPGNSHSQRYAACGGHNISFTSSGVRLVTAIVTSLLNTEYDTYLVDEPELGISPEAQGVLADFLFDRNSRKKYFSHIRTLVLATHSTVFLDHRKIDNNYAVSKSGNEIEIQRVSTRTDFNRIHFFLLGNRFETLYLPSLICLVEGISDHAFITRVLSCKYPSHRLSVIAANSDNRIKEIVNVARDLLTDLRTSPYRDRIVVVLDSVHSSGMKSRLIEAGVLEPNIVTWPENGIEHYYPPTILETIFGLGGELQINGDVVSRNGIEIPKTKLAERVVSLVDSSTPMHETFDARFLNVVNEILATGVELSPACELL